MIINLEKNKGLSGRFNMIKEDLGWLTNTLKKVRQLKSDFEEKIFKHAWALQKCPYDILAFYLDSLIELQRQINKEQKKIRVEMNLDR